MALDDFYDWTPTGITNFIMLAGSSLTVTDFDIWMMRDWWRNLSNRYNLKVAAAAVPVKVVSISTSAKPVATLKTSTTKKAVVPTTSLKPVVKTTSSAKPVVATPKAASALVAAAYTQCGGEDWKGATVCVAGLKCVVYNQWYSQCI